MTVLTGLVYVAVILLWAVVLIPQWLRRHERNSEHRTTLTFHRAMRTLERRRANRGMSKARHDMDVTVAGARSRVHDRVRLDTDSSPIDEHLATGADPFQGTETEEHLRRVRTLRAKSEAVTVAETRRRQVQQVLVGLTVVGLIAGILGFVPLILGLLPAVGLGAFWFASSKQRANVAGRQLHETRQRNRSQRQRRDRPRRRDDSGQHLATDETQPLPKLVEVPTDSWEATDAPLPAYLNSERGVRRRASHDSDVAYDWTAERMLEQAEALRAPGADAEAELGLDDFVDVPGWDEQEDHYRHRRAVNE